MPSKSEHAWNPGIQADIPQKYQHLESIYNPENVFTSRDQVQHIKSQTGLGELELTSFRPHRLALQEVISQITADILIREGKHEESLGIRFREITLELMHSHIEPTMPQIEERFNLLKQTIETAITDEINTTFFNHSDSDPIQPNGFWESLFANRSKKSFSTKPAHESPEEAQFRLISNYKYKSSTAKDDFSKSIYYSIFRVLGGVINKRGFLGQDKVWLISICTSHACNKLGRALVSKEVSTLLAKAITDNNYALIPDAKDPILISLKGTSAAGKSSLRPKLREIMHGIGVENLGYGIISPDIWRKLLLNYNSLGNAYKYAGRMTSLEVNVIDACLDRYIRDKSRKNNAIPHLLVDRFRFDSFESGHIAKVLHKTYVSNIHTLYMFFVITPPEATVERGWLRGLERGRYKCVEDFLGHSVEAYTGIPKLFFKWMNLASPHFVFEFLDNSVDKGIYPTLIARGTQEVIDIYDPIGLINIERYQKINIMARTPEDVYPGASKMQITNNIGFLLQCINKLSVVSFVDRKTDKTYLQTINGKAEILNFEVFNKKSENDDYRAIFAAIGLNDL